MRLFRKPCYRYRKYEWQGLTWFIVKDFEGHRVTDKPDENEVVIGPMSKDQANFELLKLARGNHG